MQQAEEAAAEAEAQRDGVFLRIAHGRVVELELLERVAQVAVFAAVGGVDAGIDHRLDGLIAGQRLGARVFDARDGVAHARVGDVFDRRGQIADLARAERVDGVHARRAQRADLDDLIFRAGGHHAHVHSGAQYAVFDA